MNAVAPTNPWGAPLPECLFEVDASFFDQDAQPHPDLAIEVEILIWQTGATAGEAAAMRQASAEPCGHSSLGAVVRDHRVAAGLTLRELATSSYLSAVDLGRIERGVWVPPAGVLAAVFVAIDSVGVGS